MAARQVRKRTRKTAKKYRFQLSLSGIVGMALVGFCLFLWMFLLGIWAGQTILLAPAAKSTVTQKSKGGSSLQLDSLQVVLPTGKEKQAVQ